MNFNCLNDIYKKASFLKETITRALELNARILFLPLTRPGVPELLSTSIAASSPSSSAAADGAVTKQRGGVRANCLPTGIVSTTSTAAAADSSPAVVMTFRSGGTVVDESLLDEVAAATLDISCRHKKAIG